MKMKNLTLKKWFKSVILIPHFAGEGSRTNVRVWHLPEILRLRLRMTLIVFFVCFFTFYFLLLPFARGQRELDDYLYQYEKYRDFRETYLEARASYLTYQTLTAEQEAIKTAQDFLFSRSIVIRTYLQALKEQLRQAPSIVSDEKRDLILKLDNEVIWLSENEKEIRNLSDATFDDLLEISLRVERREGVFKNLTYRTLSNIVLGKMRLLQTEAQALNFLLEEEIGKNGEKMDLVTLKQWLETVKEKTYLSQKQIEKAEDILLRLKQGGGESAGQYREIQSELDKARLILLGAIDYQQEILREVKSE